MATKRDIEKLKEGDGVWVRHRVARDVLQDELCLTEHSMWIADIAVRDIKLGSVAHLGEGA